MKLKLSLISTPRRRRILFLSLFLVSSFVILFEQEKSRVLNFPNNEIIDYLSISECGVVLTGSSGRIRESFEAFAQRKFAKLVISGVYKDTKLHEIFPQLPFYPEINPEDVVLEKISGSTYGNAVQSLLVSETLKCRSLTLMTSDIHMYRAYRMFRVLFPKEMRIEKYHISAKENTLFDVYLETFKSLFYDVLIFFVSIAS